MKILNYANFWHKNFSVFKIKNINAFTLAEMMVVLLIMSIILAAMAPVMTTRMRSESSQSTIWRWAGLDSVDAYFGVGNSQSAMIGQSTKAATDSGKLIINTPDDSTPVIELKNNGSLVANIQTTANSLLVGTMTANSKLSSNTVAIGRNLALEPTSATSHINNSVVIGEGAKTTRYNAIAIGSEASVGAVNDAGTPVSYGEYSVAIGVGAKSGSDRGISIGYQAGSRNQNSDSLAIGYQALMSNAGGYNIAIGSKALSSNTSAIGNTAIGYNALHLNKEAGANNNTAVGIQALPSNVSGDSNTALGAYAGYKNTSGSVNTFIGKQAGRGNTTGAGNVAIGADALFDNATGSQNTAVGAGALVNAYQYDVSGPTNVSNNTALGYGACKAVKGSNKTCIGATSGPAADSAEAADDSNVVYLGTADSTVYIQGNLRVDGDVELATESGVIRVRTEYGEGGLAPLTRMKDFGGYFKRTGVTGEGPYLPSDRRLKYVGKEFTSGLDKIRQLKVFNYTYKKDDKKVPHVGVIAQDLQKVFPDAVKKGSDGFLTIRKEDMFYALINAVKELDAKISVLIENQKQILKELNALRKENKELKKRLDKLERR